MLLNSHARDVDRERMSSGRKLSAARPAAGEGKKWTVNFPQRIEDSYLKSCVKLIGGEFEFLGTEEHQDPFAYFLPLCVIPII